MSGAILVGRGRQHVAYSRRPNSVQKKRACLERPERPRPSPRRRNAQGPFRLTFYLLPSPARAREEQGKSKGRAREEGAPRTRSCLNVARNARHVWRVVLDRRVRDAT